jgi:hypothetical protein
MTVDGEVNENFSVQNLFESFYSYPQIVNVSSKQLSNEWKASQSGLYNVKQHTPDSTINIFIIWYG